MENSALRIKTRACRRNSKQCKSGGWIYITNEAKLKKLPIIEWMFPMEELVTCHHL